MSVYTERFLEEEVLELQENPSTLCNIDKYGLFSRPEGLVMTWHSTSTPARGVHRQLELGGHVGV